MVQNVQQDIELKVTFAPRTEADALQPVARTIHRLRSLAQTGDLAPVAIPGMLALAGASAFAAFIIWRRRGDDEKDEGNNS